MLEADLHFPQVGQLPEDTSGLENGYLIVVQSPTRETSRRGGGLAGGGGASPPPPSMESSPAPPWLDLSSRLALTFSQGQWSQGKLRESSTRAQEAVPGRVLL